MTADRQTSTPQNSNEINASVQSVQRTTAGVSDVNQTDPVTAAAMWLSEQKTPPAPVIPILREKFPLSLVQACEACRRADDMRIRRRAFA